MGEGSIRINALGVYRSGNIAFDVAYDQIGAYPVTSMNWGLFSDWTDANWKSVTSGSNFHQSGGNILIADNPTARHRCIVNVQSGIFSNAKVEADITPLVNYEGQLMLGYKNAGNFYFGGIGDDGYTAAITKVAASAYTVIAHTATSGTKIGLTIGTPYKIKFESAGDYLFLYKDGMLICWVKDVGTKTGNVGITNSRSKAAIDNYRVLDSNNIIRFQDNFGDYVKEMDFYVVNKEASPLECDAIADNITPTGLTPFIDVSWDISNPINGASAEKVKVKMEVLKGAPAGDFTYDFVITGRTP